jgi:hypothetical protein
MRLLAFIDSWKEKTFLQIFTIYLRYLIGGAFVMAAFGMGKLDGTSNLLGSMDHPIQDLQPIQQFFRVMADSGLYWKFIGWTQIAAGMLLMTQRLARIGALIFLGLISNIFVITVAYGFQGTPVVTGLMLLATVYLIVWDTRAFLVLVTDHFVRPPQALRVHDSRFWVGLGSLLAVFIVVCGVMKVHPVIQIGSCLALGFSGFLYFFLLHSRAAKIDSKESIHRD